MSNQGISSLLMWLFPVQCIKINQCNIVFVCVICYAVYLYHVYPSLHVGEVALSE